MNHYRYLVYLLTGIISLSGCVYAEQMVDELTSLSDNISPVNESYLSDIDDIVTIVNEQKPPHSNSSALYDDDLIDLSRSDNGELITEQNNTLISPEETPEVTTGTIPPGWMTYQADPRYMILIPPQWSVYRTKTTIDNGTIIMFWDNQLSPSFVSVMAAENPGFKSFTEEEANDLEWNYILPSFKRWGVNLIPDAGAFGQLNHASISHCVMAGERNQQVISSYLLSDSSSYYWISLIGTDYDTYQENVDIFTQILETFTPYSSTDAAKLWLME